jgi:polysaccharide biosynthesis transport protein
MIRDEIDQEEGGGLGGFFSQLPTILWERKWWIIVPLVIGVLAALVAIVVLRPVYQSSALMLVQSRQLPNEILSQTNPEVVDRRIARIRQQITSRPDLVSLIQRHGLYPDERESRPLADVVNDMRDSITLTPASVGVATNRSDERTIAFKLAYDYHEPARAQSVAQDLMDKILELDASGNVEQATNTAQFLEEQAKGLEQQISQIEGEIRAVNAEYGGVLTSGVTVLGGGGGSYDVQIAALQRDNANLINQKQIAQTSDNRDPVVVQAETALAADVVIARQRLAEARELAKSNTQKLPLDNIDQQISFNNSQIAALRQAKAAEQAQTSAQLAAQSRAPLVQQQVASLQQRLRGVTEQYQTVQSRLLAARAGVRAEDEQLSERLSVVEPPIIPEEPIWPDRLLILAIGLGGGLAVGFILSLAVELILRPIRDADTLASITGAQPLGLVPVIEPTAIQARRGLRRFIPQRLT